METLVWLGGLVWGLICAGAAFSSGKPYLWRVAIFLGPLAYLILGDDQREKLESQRNWSRYPEEQNRRLRQEQAHSAPVKANEPNAPVVTVEALSATALTGAALEAELAELVAPMEKPGRAELEDRVEEVRPSTQAPPVATTAHAVPSQQHEQTLPLSTHAAPRTSYAITLLSLGLAVSLACSVGLFIALQKQNRWIAILSNQYLSEFESKDSSSSANPNARSVTGPSGTEPTKPDLVSPVKPRAAPQTVLGKKTVLGTVTFFGQQATGNRIVYLLDASGSMSNHNAIEIAKAELKASLQRLESTQQFQIIFYNSQPSAMRLRGSNDALFWGTNPNRLLADQFIDSISPGSGTNHIEALRMATRLGADVIFLLTDADEPRLTGVELEEVRKRNGGKAQIHTIEFGRGTDLDFDNFLKKMPRQNGGTHTYRDVTRF